MSTTNENILTTSLARELAPGLLRNTIDERIVRIRPMSTPIDQISRCAGARSSKSMIVEYYSVDTKPTSARLTAEASVTIPSDSDVPATVTLHTDRDSIFDTSETLLVPDSSVSLPAGGREPMRLYVTGRLSEAAGGGVECIVTNIGENRAGCRIDDLPAGVEIVRMGRAAAELDVQTPQFAVLPKKPTIFARYSRCRWNKAPCNA